MRKEKQFLLDEAKQLFDKYPAFLVISYKGLTANQANAFRGEVAKAGGDVEVLSRRMLRKAAEAVGVHLDLADLQGHLGVVFLAADPLETTKTVISFGQTNNKSINVLAGRFPDGRLYHAADVEKLSKLPAMPEMRAQFLATLEAPMSQTLAVMEALLTSVIYCIEEKSKQ